MRHVWIIFVFFILAGCATTPVYNPILSAVQPEVLLNESSLAQVKEGMSVDQVHVIMGQELVIGYAKESDSYKPLTIPNPYKVEEIKDRGYLIEYYIASIRQTDGIVHDDQLMPLVYKDGKLIGRGWPLVNSLRPSHPVS